MKVVLEESALPVTLECSVVAYRTIGRIGFLPHGRSAQRSSMRE